AAVDPVSSYEQRGVQALAADAAGDALLPALVGRHADPVPELRACLSRLFCEVGVQPPPLRQIDQRGAVAALDRPPVAQAKVDPGGDVLDDRIDRARHEPRGALGDAPAAGFVAGEAGAIEE